MKVRWTKKGRDPDVKSVSRSRNLTQTRTRKDFFTE